MREQLQQRFAWPGTPADVAAFEQHHAENPHVYEQLRRFALEAKSAGVVRMGIAALYERVRWFTTVETQGDTFKVNNTWRAFYARKLMQEEPALAGFFEIRRSRADEGE